ncbi:MAG: biotin/lipoyl-binding protein [Pseudomonadota bacterium]
MNILKRLLRILLPVLILAGAAAGAAALYKSRPQAEPLEIKEKVWAVEVTQVRRAAQNPELTLYGRVESPRSARLSAALTADVADVHVREGQLVDAGDVLVTLDERESALNLRQREAERAEIDAQVEIENQRNRNDQEALQRELRVLELARRAVKRAQDLARTNVGSRSQLDSARQEEEQRSMAVDARRTALDGHRSRLAQLTARHARAKALEDRARLDLSRTKVTAPFTGPVYNVEVSTGDRVQPGTLMVGMYDITALELRAQIPGAYLPGVQAAIAADKPVTALAQVDTRRISATLTRLGARVVRGSGGVDGLFTVTEGGEWLQIGRTVEFRMELPPARGAIALPSSAVYSNRYVYRVENGRLQRVDITRIGEFNGRDGRQVLVRSARLKIGDSVITTQLPNASDGLKVAVRG